MTAESDSYSLLVFLALHAGQLRLKEAVDNKENIDTNYSSTWYYYFK